MLFEVYGNMQSHEREYFLTRQRPMLQLALNVAIRSKFNDFDLQAHTIDSISAKLINLTSQEVERGYVWIDWLSQLAAGVLAVATLQLSRLTRIEMQQVRYNVSFIAMGGEYGLRPR